MTQRLLVRATGRVEPGQLATVSRMLDDSGVRLLDIDQRVTLGQTVFEVLVDGDEDASTLTQRLQAAWPAVEKETGLELSLLEIDQQAQQRWQSLNQAPVLVMTLMATHFSVDLLAQVDQLISRWNLGIERIQRLSGPSSLVEAAPAEGVCFEYHLRGEAVDTGGLRQALLTLATGQGVDIALQEENLWRHQRRLICFDMDSTLIKAEVIDELARRHGVFDAVAAITERAMRGEIDFQQSFRQRMSMLNGLSESVLEEVAEGLALMDGLERLMTNLKRLGYRTAILSGGFTYFARYLQKRLGFDEVHANELVIDEGVVTGEVQLPIVDAERKAVLLKEIAERHGIAPEQTVAVGDGANDLKMLAGAGLGIAFHAKPLVREKARISVSTLGLDAILYLLGHDDRTLQQG
ncbi:phosphoserine phosphatase SerB [Kushneria indalinina]|uniref:Phosphoserine phosphatase n=1 Tax=Kushneria indalinina DSM 14324 TaxID=1122140 RepID=A0A3D9DVH7_9GAMM|nr:phosphoserine phosphatase SerB [Kushneria indalinina]REC94399.1 phosphoserine phosphatase [Kushneria indalinina DSM 14324]